MDDWRGRCPIPKETIPDYERQEFITIFSMVWMKGLLIIGWIAINYVIWLFRAVTFDWDENFLKANLFTHIFYTIMTVILICKAIKKPQFIAKIKNKYWGYLMGVVLIIIIISGFYNEYHEYWF